MFKFLLRKFLESRGVSIAELEKTVLAATKEADRMDSLMDEFEAKLRSDLSEAAEKQQQKAAQREQELRERQAARKADLAKWEKAEKERVKPKPAEVYAPNVVASVAFREGQLDPVFAKGEDDARLSKQDADKALRRYAETRARDEATDLIMDVAEWLITESTLDDRHGMLGFNWDHGYDIPAWIIRQPDTDIATVLRAFDLAQPQFYLELLAKGDDIPPHASKGFDFVVETGRRIAGASYTPPSKHNAIGYTPPRVTWDQTSPSHKAVEALIIPQTAFTALPGRNPDTIYPRIPDDWAEVLN